MVFGEREDQVGIVRDGESRWIPQFAAVNSQNLQVVLDVYKSRFSLFDSDQKYVRSVNFPQGLSPRVNWFFINKNDFGCVLADSTFYIFSPDLQLKKRFPLPLGTTVVDLFANTEAIYFRIGTGASFRLDWQENKFAQVDSLQPIRVGGLKFGFTLGEQRSLWGFPKAVGQGTEQAQLICIDELGNSYWRFSNETEWFGLVFDKAGTWKSNFGLTSVGDEKPGISSGMTADLRFWGLFYTERSLTIKKSSR